MLYKGKNLFKRPYNHGLQVCNADNFQGSHEPPTPWENIVQRMKNAMLQRQAWSRGPQGHSLVQTYLQAPALTALS